MEINGTLDGDTVLDRNLVLNGMATRSVTVPSGVVFTLNGTVGRKLIVQEGGVAVVHGTVGDNIVLEGGLVELWGVAGNKVVIRDGVLRKHNNAVIRGSLVYEFDLDQKPVQLVIDGHRFVPYSYQEEHWRGGLLIRARLELTSEQWDELLALREAKDGEVVSVVREGVSDDPIEVRIGQGPWSQDGENIKAQITLFDEAARLAVTEDEPQPFWGAKERAAAGNRMLVRGLERLDALLAKLQEKGIVSEQDVLEIERSVEAGIWRRFEELNEVEDADKWED